MKNIILLMCLFLLSGCGTVLKHTDSLANAAIANDLVMSGRVAETIKSAPLTDAEILIVDHAINAYGGFVERWKHSITSFDPTSDTFTVFVLEFEIIAGHYTSVENIIIKNWDSYSPLHKALLADYQNRARKVRRSVEDLLSSGRRHQAMIDGLVLVKILAGIALKI